MSPATWTDPILPLTPAAETQTGGTVTRQQPTPIQAALDLLNAAQELDEVRCTADDHEEGCDAYVHPLDCANRCWQHNEDRAGAAVLDVLEVLPDAVRAERGSLVDRLLRLAPVLAQFPADVAAVNITNWRVSVMARSVAGGEQVAAALGLPAGGFRLDRGEPYWEAGEQLGDHVFVGATGLTRAEKIAALVPADVEDYL